MGFHCPGNLYKIEDKTCWYTNTLTRIILNKPVLKIRRGKRDNLEIIFHIAPLKLMLGSIIRTVYQDGSNEGSQHMFFVEK